MNSLVSFDWLREYVKLTETPEEFARRISLSGPAVEKIVPLHGDLDGIVVGKIKEINPHPNADKLRVVMVDIGRETPAQIVCGGINLEPHQWVAVATVGSKVRWHGQGDLVTMELAELRGVKSEGMICAANEIGLGDAFPMEDRMILDLGREFGWTRGLLKPGSPVADVLGGASDVAMDIEVPSNRVDAMGMVGMAREASAILNRPFTWNEPKLPVVARRAVSLRVTISAKKQCPRYMAAKIEGVKVGPSPWWMKRRLMSAGLRPINNLVDISNYVMLELAQPTHIFDASTVVGGIDVRLARQGEKIMALDGKTYDLDDTVLLIADDEKPIAVAGVMGGEHTGVNVNTTDVIIECATFDPVVIRRGARRLNLQSDAQLRFEKGLSTAALPEAMARTIKLVREIAGGKIAGPIADVGETKYEPLSFSVTTDEVNGLIGVEIPKKEMVERLRRLGFKVGLKGKTIHAVVPWWRDHDIESGRDLVEEIARIEGYANIPGKIPFGLGPRPMDPELVWERRARDISKGAGLTETYTYSFVSSDLLAKAGYDASKMLRVQNPLTAEFEFMRTTLLPSLLQVAAENTERASDIRLFEVANVYYPRKGDLPDEQLELGALFMGMGEPWRVAKGYVEHLLGEMGLADVSWRRLSTDSFWHPGRTVQAFHKGALVATVGEVSPKVAAAFKLGPVALVDIPLEAVVPHAKTAKAFAPVSTFPDAKRDLAIIVDWRVEFDDVARAISRTSPLITNVEWFDTYRGANLPEEKKSLAMHLTFSSPDRTLESTEVDGLMEKISLGLKEEYKAEMRG